MDRRHSLCVNLFPEKKYMVVLMVSSLPFYFNHEWWLTEAFSTHSHRWATTYLHFLVPCTCKRRESKDSFPHSVLPWPGLRQQEHRRGPGFSVLGLWGKTRILNKGPKVEQGETTLMFAFLNRVFDPPLCYQHGASHTPSQAQRRGTSAIGPSWGLQSRQPCSLESGFLFQMLPGDNSRRNPGPTVRTGDCLRPCTISPGPKDNGTGLAEVEQVSVVVYINYLGFSRPVS